MFILKLNNFWSEVKGIKEQIIYVIWILLSD